MPASWEVSTAAALDALEPVSTRDLIRSARAFERGGRDTLGLFRFAGTFRALAFDRHERLAEPSRYTQIQIESAVLLVRPELADRPADAPELFWQHVRDAVLAFRAEASWDEED